MKTYLQTYMAESDLLRSAETEKVFNNLVNAHLNEIYNFAYHMVFDYDEANDIAQKTFISLYKNFSKLDLTTSPRPWLFKVARNNCLDYLKKKKNLPFSNIEEEIIEEIPSENLSIESKLDEILFLEKFSEHVSALPEQMKTVLLMRYFDDLTFEQIADIQNLPVNTVKSNFYRGKQRLYKIINN